MQSVLAPPGGMKMVAFLDDFNMPSKSQFGYTPPLELLKLWIDHGLWWVPLPEHDPST